MECAAHRALLTLASRDHVCLPQGSSLAIIIPSLAASKIPPQAPSKLVLFELAVFPYRGNSLKLKTLRNWSEETKCGVCAAREQGRHNICISHFCWQEADP